MPDFERPMPASMAVLRSDAVAGATAAAVVLPKAMAYATVAGLPVAFGPYTTFVPAIVYGVLGSSRLLSVRSTTTLAILTGAEPGTVVPDGDPARTAIACATLTALIGALLIAARLLKLGLVANFNSLPVLTGFKAGIELVILLDQAPKLLRLHIAKLSFFADAASLVRHLPETSVPTLTVAGITLTALIAAERVKPHSPAPLLMVAAAITASFLLDFGARGIPTVGPIPQGLPGLSLPDPALVQALLPGAVGIALMSFAESIAAARAFAAMGDPPIDANRELAATGAANLGGAFLGAMPAGGGTSQTGVVRAAGGRTQAASLFAEAALATMLVLAPSLSLLPHATLASTVVVYFCRPDPARRVQGRRQGPPDGVPLGRHGGHRGARLRHAPGHRRRGGSVARRPRCPDRPSDGRRDRPQARQERPAPLSPEHPDDEIVNGLRIIRPVVRLYFANAQNVGDTIRALIAQHEPRVVLLDFSRVPDLEHSALSMLQEGVRRTTVTVWLADLNAGVLDMVRRAGLDEELGPDHLLFDVHQAIRRYEAMQAKPALD